MNSRTFILIVAASILQAVADLPACSTPFADIGAPILPVSESACAWGDYDNDDQMDLAVAGNGASGPVCRIYRNSTGAFSDSGAVLTGVRLACLAWGDYDNDGDLDLAVSGHTGTAYACTIYRNSVGSFKAAAQLPGVVYGSLIWGDMDNDGDLDLALAGWTGTARISRVYRNDKGVFTDTNALLPPVSWCTVRWGDFDNDGDLDLALNGWTGTGRTAAIYRNNAGTISGVLAELPPIEEKTALADFNNDGLLDIAQCGSNAGIRTARILANSGAAFAESPAGLQGLTYADAAWGDYDNDGRPDLLLAGWTGSVPQISLYHNQPAGSWPAVSTGLTPVYNGAVAWGDYDNDGDLDLAVTGQSSSGASARIYRNDTSARNSPPLAPTGLRAEYTAAGLRFSWIATGDDHTPSPGLSYEIRVGSVPRAGDIVGNAPAPLNGFRRQAARGSISTTHWTLKDPVAGTYYWSVQAIDASFRGSQWAAEGTASLSPKSWNEGDYVEIPSAVVSAAYPGYYYVQDEGRAWGIRVEQPDHTARPGRRVQIQGTLATNADHERVLLASGAIALGDADVTAMGVTGRMLGGADGPSTASGAASQQGVHGGLGLNNIGLLMKLTGRVTRVDSASGILNVDDGSRVIDGGGWAGVRVLASGMTMPVVGDMVSVVGVSSCYWDGSHVRRLLRVRQEGDIGWIAAAGPGPAPASLLLAQRDLYRPWIVGLSWRASASAGTITYRIYRRLQGATQFSLIGSTTALSYTDTAIPGDKVYSRIEYRVTAVDFRGIAGNPSSISAVNAVDNPPPPPD